MTQTVFTKAAKKLVKAYASVYESKFGTPPMEDLDEALILIASLLNDIDENGYDYKNMVESLELAIKWYILYHNSTNAAGQTFSKSLKSLLTSKGNWLLNTCIEQGRTADFALLEKTKDASEATRRAVKRGDLRVFDEKDDVMSLVQTCLQKIGKIEKHTKGFRRYAKDDPALRDLFKTEVPQLKYVKKALKLLDKMEKEALEIENI